MCIYIHTRTHTQSISQLDLETNTSLSFSKTKNHHIFLLVYPILYFDLREYHNGILPKPKPKNQHTKTHELQQEQQAKEANTGPSKALGEKLHHKQEARAGAKAWAGGRAGDTAAAGGGVVPEQAGAVADAEPREWLRGAAGEAGECLGREDAAREGSRSAKRRASQG